MSLQEKGRVLRLAVSLLGKAAGRESILPAGFTNRCRSLVPLGAGATAGVKGRPIFTRPVAVWHHLRRMQQYSAKRWAQQQQARVARQQSKRRRAQGTTVKSASAQQPHEVKCPGKGGAKRSVGAYASDFYAGPVLPPGTRRGPQCCVTEEPDSPAGTARFLPRHKSAQWRDALSKGHGCLAFGSAWHTNTDNAHHVQLWVGGCGTAVPGDMPGIRDRRWPCGAASGGHEERRPTPLGRGAHHRRRDADGSGDWTRDRAGCGITSEEGWTQPPPPPLPRGGTVHRRALLGTEEQGPR